MLIKRLNIDITLTLMPKCQSLSAVRMTCRACVEVLLCIGRLDAVLAYCCPVPALHHLHL